MPSLSEIAENEEYENQKRESKKYELYRDGSYEAKMELIDMEIEDKNVK